jgi:transposase|tara:strand:+ start:63 stop:500 length:438 start_codon:yes stop_codon:yes gene_type:complete
MKRIIIELKEKEILFLKKLLKTGTNKARKLARANILLLANKGKQSDEIAMLLSVNRSTVAQVKKRHIQKGITYALEEKPRSGQPIKYTKKNEAEIIAQACTSAPKGRKRWSVRLLTKELRKKKDLRRINRESIRLVLKKAKLSLG